MHYTLIPESDLIGFRRFGRLLPQNKPEQESKDAFECSSAGAIVGILTMSGSKTVVVTAYGAWAKTATNPAAQTLARLSAQTWHHCRFIPIEVPVETNGLLPLVEDALLTYRPTLWMGLGVAPGALGMRAEAIGINCRDFDVADNDGVTLDGAPIVESGAAGYFATLPVRDIVAAIQAQGIPAALSYSAGTHLCNQMLYSSLHLIERFGLNTRCGFLHVPYSPEFVARELSAEDAEPSMAVDLMATAARTAIDVSLKQIEEDAVAGGSTDDEGLALAAAEGH